MKKYWKVVIWKNGHKTAEDYGNYKTRKGAMRMKELYEAWNNYDPTIYDSVEVYGVVPQDGVR